MSYSFIGLNNFNMPAVVFGGWYGGLMPVMSYSYYNPFSVFNTAAQLVSKSWISNLSSFTIPWCNYNFYDNDNFKLPSLSIWEDALPNYNSMNDGWNLYRFEDYLKNDYSAFGSVTSSYSLLSREPEKSSKKHYESFLSTRPIYTTMSKSYLNKEFLDKVKQVAKNINCDYEDLLAVMNSESSLDPSSVHKNNNGVKTAAGLIQFTKNAAIPELNKHYGLDLTIEKIESMSALEQLDLVEKYYKMHEDKFPDGRKLTAADLYAITFLPARANNNVLTRSGESYYTKNRGLDVNNDGIITKSDLNVRLAQKRVNLNTFV